MLSEEAVRCTMAIMQVGRQARRQGTLTGIASKQPGGDRSHRAGLVPACLPGWLWLVGQLHALSLSKPDREAMRAIWGAIRWATCCCCLTG